MTLALTYIYILEFFHFFIFADISWVAARPADEQHKAMVNSSEHQFHRDLIEQK